MTDKTFEYGGYHFTPVRQFTKKENALTKIAQKLRTDIELGFCKKGYAYQSKFNYANSDFYVASTDKNCDIFRCEENGKLYVPCENDLQEYIDENQTAHEKTDIIGTVISAVAQEFTVFKSSELAKKNDEIFNNHSQIHFYCRVADYFENEDFQFYEKTAIRELAKENGEILERLWNYYSDCEEPSIESYLDIYQLIRNYNGFCHTVASGEME